MFPLCLFLAFFLVGTAVLVGCDDDDDAADDVADDDSANGGTDDDATDDDAADDDAVDDDVIPDDDIPLDCPTIVEGGWVGWRGTGAAVALNGDLVVATNVSRDLYFFTSEDGGINWTKERALGICENLEPQYPVLQFDAAGNPHLLFYDDASFYFTHASRTSRGWEITPLFYGAYYCENKYEKTLAVDHDGFAHACYNDDGDILCASNQSGEWATETIGGGTSPSLAVSSDNQIRLAYLDQARKPQLAVGGPGAWQATQIDDTSYIAVSLALDGDDHNHVAGATGLTLLRYLNDVGGSWRKKTIYRHTLFTVYVKILTDSQGKAHIGAEYLTYDDDSGKYIPSPSYHWVLYKFEPSGSFEQLYHFDYPATLLDFTLDQQDNPHILYSRTHLHHVTDASGSWGDSVMYQSSDVGKFVDIAVDQDNQPHISYIHDDINALQYAKRSDGEWQIQMIDPADDYHFSSLALDVEGHAHVAYANRDTRLRYATNAGGAWQKNFVFTADEKVAGISLALDAAGEPIVSYCDTQSGSVNVRQKTEGNWTLLYQNFCVCQDTALAVDPAGGLHLLYTVDREGAFYATDQGGAWAKEQIAPHGNAQIYLLADPDGGLHGSVLGHTAPMYLTNVSGDWDVQQTIPFGVETWPGTPLALNSAGNAFILFYDKLRTGTYPPAYLKMAHNRKGEWRSATLDNHGAAGQYSAIAVDRNDICHVAYYSENALWYLKHDCR